MDDEELSQDYEISSGCIRDFLQSVEVNPRFIKSQGPVRGLYK